MDPKLITNLLMNNPIPDGATYRAFADITVEAYVKELAEDYDALVDLWISLDKPELPTDPYTELSPSVYTSISEAMLYAVAHSLKMNIPPLLRAISFVTGSEYTTTEQAITALRNFKKENN